ncbi:uncharacterized protein C10orf143 homolog isoform X1 [Ovis canadensis]|uniref:uncharacterized protein C10orf143 homolog isoform X1 n=1 Tax=Ovis canadensis TaxID=37174 RepID=UPI003750694F
MCLWLLRRPRRFCVQSQGPSRLLRAAVPESNRHVQALGWVWYGCEASRHSSRLLRESRKRACRRLDAAAPERDCPQVRVRIPASGGSEEPESLDAQRRGRLPSPRPDSGQRRPGMGGPPDGGRSRAQPCPRCIAGESERSRAVDTDTLPCGCHQDLASVGFGPGVGLQRCAQNTCGAVCLAESQKPHPRPSGGEWPEPLTQPPRSRDGHGVSPCSSSPPPDSRATHVSFPWSRCIASQA